MKSTIQLPITKPGHQVSSEQIKALRTYENFICIADDAVLLKKLDSKRASEIIKRLKGGDVIELKG